MDTVCHKQLHFGSLFGKKIIACFHGGRMNSDSGTLLLGEIDKAYGLMDRAACCLTDRRDPGRILEMQPASLKSIAPKSGL